MAMTPEAKRKLSSTIRGLRELLLRDLHDALDSEYLLSVRAQDAGLPERLAGRRRRFEEWLAEQVRAQRGTRRRSREDFRREVEVQAAATWLNRLVMLRLMESWGLRTPKVVTGGWESVGYRNFLEVAPALAENNVSEGYVLLLQLIFEDLASDLPGLFGPSGVTDLIPMPPATLRAVVEALDEPLLASCWTDDMTLGWIYQYWNDPERERLDEKLNAGGKVEPHEIASKTQMFTERYMVDWLLQNSLGPMWLAMCRRHGWTAEVEADGTLDRLEARRVAWRAKRDSGEVSLTELMPLETDAEQRWAYYVPQPIPEDAVEHAPDSVRNLRILDPAVGSGHFLVVAFDLLAALYREEARHRGEAGGEAWTERALVERILEVNLAGLDLDPRAVQIAAAALWLKAQLTCREAHPKRMNLVASNLRLASLPDDDPALVELRLEVERETGIPGTLTDLVVHALQGADHLGSLLQVDAAVEQALTEHESALSRAVVRQGDLWSGFVEEQRVPIAREVAKATVLERLETFLSRHTGAEDLGLRLRGEQLAAGVRFVRLLREGSYDLVVGNPPYLGASKMQDPAYVKRHYPAASADLFAALMSRGLSLVRRSGLEAMVTLRNWLFTKTYSELRTTLLYDFHLQTLADLSWASFEEMRDNPVAMFVIRASAARGERSVAISPGDPQMRVRTTEAFHRKRAGTLAGEGNITFSTEKLSRVQWSPLVYWWTESELSLFERFPACGQLGGSLQGISTANNVRFLRSCWELPRSRIFVSREPTARNEIPQAWVPYIKGAASKRWLEPLGDVLNWRRNATDILESSGSAWRNDDAHFRLGVSFPRVGDTFSARLHRFASAFDAEGPTLLADDPSSLCCFLNSKLAHRLMSGLNPTVHFTQGDVDRLPLVPIVDSHLVSAAIESRFSEHESHRESSIEFLCPGPSPWRYAQQWAQAAVDRPKGAPLPPYEPELDSEPPTDHISFALGVALGRFGQNGEGILDPSEADLSHALPAGILFLNGSLDPLSREDGLGHAAADTLWETWEQHGSAIDPANDLRAYLRTRFFTDVHRKMYENRPIHWPLTSGDKTFVAWINIHRWSESTLRVLLADHLQPALRRVEGELEDLKTARTGADRAAVRAADRRFDQVKGWQEELTTFISDVSRCAEAGPPPTDTRCEAREADARYYPNLDDGVMVNSAALWPLLEPQWKDPEKWWKELANAQGKKDYDWSHLALRYWPKRVDEKCQRDPSLAVAHGCFWKYHPARAWSWELRLQQEIGPGFRIEEAAYRGDGGDRVHRSAYLLEKAEEALASVEKEAQRRFRKLKAAQPELVLLEDGLWSAEPRICWEMEIRVSEKQGAEWFLRAPDEPAARAAFESAHPKQVLARAAIMKGLAPLPGIDYGDEAGEEAEAESPEDEEAGA